MAFAIGCFALAASAICYLLWHQKVDPTSTDPTLALIVASAFALLGLYGMWRGGFIIDEDKQRLIRWTGPFIPLDKKIIPFSQVTWVSVGQGNKPGVPQAARMTNWTYHVAVYHEKGLLIVRFTKSLDDANLKANLIANVVGCECKQLLA